MTNKSHLEHKKNEREREKKKKRTIIDEEQVDGETMQEKGIKIVEGEYQRRRLDERRMRENLTARTGRT